MSIHNSTQAKLSHIIPQMKGHDSLRVPKPKRTMYLSQYYNLRYIRKKV